MTDQFFYPVFEKKGESTINSDINKRIILLGIALIALITLPFFVDLFYQTFYYVGSLLLIIVASIRVVLNQKFEERFYQRWKEQSKQGFWINVVRLGLRSFVMMANVVFISQLFAYARTPLDIITQLTIGETIWILVILLLFSFITGIATWFDNQKRFKRIFYNKQSGKIK